MAVADCRNDSPDNSSHHSLVVGIFVDHQQDGADKYKYYMEAQLLVPNNSAELEQTYKTESNLPLPCGQPGTLKLFYSKHWEILIGANKHSEE